MHIATLLNAHILLMELVLYTMSLYTLAREHSEVPSNSYRPHHIHVSDEHRYGKKTADGHTRVTTDNGVSQTHIHTLILLPNLNAYIGNTI